MFVRGSPHASLSGRKPPLIPPYQGGKTSPPSAESPRRREFVAVVPLIRGIPPKGGGGLFLKLSPRRGSPPHCFPIGNENGPPSGEYVPKRRRVLFVRGSPTASLSGRKPPLIPPYQGGKKLSPFGVALLPYREWKRPLSGRFVAVVPLIRGIPPKGGGGLFLKLSPRRGESPALLPYREENPP